MKNENHESKKILLGLLIGGIVGGGALYALRASQNRKTPVMKKIGRTISEVGEMLENFNLDSGEEMLESVQNKLPKGADVVSSLTDWVGTGLTLWNKFKKG